MKMERNNATDTKRITKAKHVRRVPSLAAIIPALEQPSLDHSDGCALLLEKVAPRRRSGLPKDRRWRGNEIASIFIPTNLWAYCKIHNCTNAMMWCWRAGTVSLLEKTTSGRRVGWFRLSAVFRSENSTAFPKRLLASLKDSEKRFVNKSDFTWK